MVDPMGLQAGPYLPPEAAKAMAEASTKIVERTGELVVAGAKYAITRNSLTPWGVYNQISDLQDATEATTTRALKVYDLHRKGGHEEGSAMALTAVQVLADQTGGTAAFEAFEGLDTNRLLDTGDFTPTLSLEERGGRYLESGVRVFGTAAGTSGARQFFQTKVRNWQLSRPAGLGDLSVGEAQQIQAVVEAADRPITVVGSAARGQRRNPGSALPLGKGPGTKSDIDYLTTPHSSPYFVEHRAKLPDIAEHGIVPGVHDPYQGPGIRFEPGVKKPVVLEQKR